MAIDSWLPIGFRLPRGALVRKVLYEDCNWQIYEGQGGDRSLVAKQSLASRWWSTGLIDASAFASFEFGALSLAELTCSSAHILCPVAACNSPSNNSQAL